MTISSKGEQTFRNNVQKVREYESKGTKINYQTDKSLAKWCGKIRESIKMKNNGNKDPHIVLTDERILLLRGIGFEFCETIAKESIVDIDVDSSVEEIDKNKEPKRARTVVTYPSTSKFHLIEPSPYSTTLPSFPNTERCEWSFDIQSRVLLGRFKIDRENPFVSEEDESFLLKMMERSDIAVVSEGLFYNSDESVWDLEFIKDRIGGDMPFNRFRLFESVLMSQENFNKLRLGHSPETTKINDNASLFRYSREIDGDITMKIKDYVNYLHTFNQFQDDKNSDPIFSFLEAEGVAKKFDVKRHSLYMIDFDFGKLLPETFEDFGKSFRLPGLLPGGEHCMMNPVRCTPCSILDLNRYYKYCGNLTHLFLL